MYMPSATVRTARMTFLNQEPIVVTPQARESGRLRDYCNKVGDGRPDDERGQRHRLVEEVIASSATTRRARGLSDRSRSLRSLRPPARPEPKGRSGLNLADAGLIGEVQLRPFADVPRLLELVQHRERQLRLSLA